MREGGGRHCPRQWTGADCRLWVVPSVCRLPSVPSSFRTEPSSVTAGQGQQLLAVPVPRKVSL